MFKKYFLLSIIFFEILSTICIGNTIFTPADCFYEKHPELKQKYIQLSPTSYDMIIDCLASNYALKKFMIKDLKANFSNNTDLINHLDAIEKKDEEMGPQTIEYLNSLKNKLKEDDYLYHFIYADEYVKETGYLILNNGEITYRESDSQIFK